MGIEARIDEFADSVSPYIEAVFDEYGIKLIKFIIAALDIDDDELRRKYDEIGMDAIAKARGAQADKAVMGILGDDWARQQAANILGSLANNPGAGGVAAAGAGMGMGLGAGGAFGSMAQEMFAPFNRPQQQPPQQPFAPASGSRFRQSDDTQQNTAENVPGKKPSEVLTELKTLLDNGLIEQAEYDSVKADILKKMGS